MYDVPNKGTTNMKFGPICLRQNVAKVQKSIGRMLFSGISTS